MAIHLFRQIWFKLVCDDTKQLHPQFSEDDDYSSLQEAHNKIMESRTNFSTRQYLDFLSCVPDDCFSKLTHQDFLQLIRTAGVTAQSDKAYIMLLYSYATKVEHALTERYTKLSTMNGKENEANSAFSEWKLMADLKAEFSLVPGLQAYQQRLMASALQSKAGTSCVTPMYAH